MIQLISVKRKFVRKGHESELNSNNNFQRTLGISNLI
jgi:hypothetical protein